MGRPMTRQSETPRTEAFAESCATYVALRFKKQNGERPNIQDSEFLLAIEHSRRLERELAAEREAAEHYRNECDRLTRQSARYEERAEEERAARERAERDARCYLAIAGAAFGGTDHAEKIRAQTENPYESGNIAYAQFRNEWDAALAANIAPLKERAEAAEAKLAKAERERDLAKADAARLESIARCSPND
jgi:multidrug resistance efflux pump